MGLTLQQSIRSRLFKTKVSQAVFVIAALLIGLTAALPFATFNNAQNASAAESWQTDGWKQISAGRNHTCAIAFNDQLFCWGSNASGQLGDNSTTDKYVPTAVDVSGALAGKTILSVSAGVQQTCAIASDAQVYCWGVNNSGQLGNGSTTDSPVPVPVDTSGVLAGKSMNNVSVGGSHVCATSSDGQVYCWGNNSQGEVGDESYSDNLTPLAINMSGALAGKTVLSVDLGGLLTCVVASDNQAYCWGTNGQGQLGAGSSEIRSVQPVAVDTSGVLANKTIKHMSVGDTAVCVVASDDQAYCWGYNLGGVLGDNTNVNAASPVAVDTSGVLSGKTISSVSVGSTSACAIASDGKSYCWGVGAFGRANSVDGPYDQSLVPVATDVSGMLAGKQLTSIGVGALHVCVLTSDKQASCWGTNTSGQLGNNKSTNENTLTPVLLGYAAPTISVLGRTNAGIDTGSYTFGIYGSNFVEGAVVTFGDVEATVLPSNLSATYMEVTLSTDGVAAGAVDVTITNPDGQNVVLNNGFTFNAAPMPAQVTGATFSQSAGRNILTVTGNDFYSASEQTSFFTRPSLVVLNNTPVPFCTDGVGLSAQQVVDYGLVPANQVSDTPTCYLIIEAGFQGYSFTQSRVAIWLANDFDIAAPGTVKVNNSSAFGFNQPVGGGDDETPTATIETNNEALDGGEIIAAQPTFTGTAPAGSTVVVTVRSDPVTCSTTADMDGNWSCTLPTSLPAGRHSVTVLVTTPDNEVINLGPYEVTVPGETITNTTPLAPNTGAKRVATIVTSHGVAPFVALGALITVMVGVAVLVIRGRILSKN